MIEGRDSKDETKEWTNDSNLFFFRFPRIIIAEERRREGDKNRISLSWKSSTLRFDVWFANQRASRFRGRKNVTTKGGWKEKTKKGSVGFSRWEFPSRDPYSWSHGHFYRLPSLSASNLLDERPT